MTPGHKHHKVRIDWSTRLGGWLWQTLRKPLRHTQDLGRVDVSPYPYGPCREHEAECYYLSALGILHRWTGLTLRVPDKE